MVKKILKLKDITLNSFKVYSAANGKPTREAATEITNTIVSIYNETTRTKMELGKYAMAGSLIGTIVSSGYLDRWEGWTGLVLAGGLSVITSAYTGWQGLKLQFPKLIGGTINKAVEFGFNTYEKRFQNNKE